MIQIRKFKIAILGESGRMGGEIVTLLSEPRFSSRLEKKDTPVRGGSLDFFFQADVWLDFSSPAAVLELCREAVKRKSKIPFIVGTTGWSATERVELEAAALHFPILHAANFSLGVQLCKMALRLWGETPELSSWTVLIRDLHHAAKKDAPSGTALALQEAFGRKLEIESIREGDAVGLHEVILECGSEKITLIHEAKSRTVFAEGALEAVLKLANYDHALLPNRLLSLDDLYLHRGARNPYK